MNLVSSRPRTLIALLSAALVLAVVPLSGRGEFAYAGPIADSAEAYALCGRVFPDPQAFWAPALGEDTPHPGVGVSPWAKGNAPCAARNYVTYDEALRGLTFLSEELEATAPLVEVIDLSTTDDPRIRAVLDDELGDGFSEGLASETGEREAVPLHLVKVTAPDGERLVDDVEPIDEPDRDHFVWSLSVHGIEKAGLEGGLRAIEDLATWGANEPERLLLETYDSETITTQSGEEAENLRVGEVLMRSVSYFVMPNPDGWRRGDADQGNAAFLRYNGNGMDLNRDWPEIGYVDPEFTPWSESESRSVGKALQAVSDTWTGGIDLHGMVAANAFSYTLIGGSQRPFDKNERTMQFVEEAWADGEERLTWSAQIKPNDAPEQCVVFTGVAPNGETHLPPGEQCDQRAYGVQYGTIWDTIEYTATGALGNWIDSPIGLDADGIDNEMMLSHLGNCGTGTCYVPDAEQLHVDGNKSLIYSMLNFSLQPPTSAFEVGGDVAYLVNPRRLVDPGVEVTVAPEGATDADDLSGKVLHQRGDTVLAEWTVDNATGPEFIGGMKARARYTNVGGESLPGDLTGLNIQYNDPLRGWTSRPVYDSLAYRSPGDHSDWNYPADGDYRLVVSGLSPVEVSWDVTLATGPVSAQPLQDAYDVTNMDFFAELEPFLGDGTTLTAITADELLAGERDLFDFDTVVAADDTLLPGYHPEVAPTQGLADLPATTYTADDATAIGAKLRLFAVGGGNVVLTDDAVRGLSWMGLVDGSAIQRRNVYAGHVSFATADGYGDPLAEGIDLPGAAEGLNKRRQTVEPLPLGYALSTTMPQWHVASSAITGAGGRVAGLTDGDADRATLAEVAVGDGVVRVMGAALTYPTTAYYHPFGLSSYGVTDSGYTLLRNLWTWENPNQNLSPSLVDADIEWVESDTPMRIFVDGQPLS